MCEAKISNFWTLWPINVCINNLHTFCEKNTIFVYFGQWVEMYTERHTPYMQYIASNTTQRLRLKGYFSSLYLSFYR